MRFYKHLSIFVLCLFLLGLSFVKVQIEIRKTSYNIAQRRKELLTLIDREGYLLYNFYKYASIKKLKDSIEGYRFSKGDNIIHIKVAAAKVSPKKRLSLARLLLNFATTARAEE